MLGMMIKAISIALGVHTSGRKAAEPSPESLDGMVLDSGPRRWSLKRVLESLGSAIGRGSRFAAFLGSGFHDLREHLGSVDILPIGVARCTACQQAVRTVERPPEQSLLHNCNIDLCKHQRTTNNPTYSCGMHEVEMLLFVEGCCGSLFLS